MSDKSSGKISIEDAIKLKHELNQEITHSGLNARQISEIEDLSNEQYDDIKNSIACIKKSWWLFPDAFFVAILLIAGICIFYFNNLKVQGISALVVLYCTAQLFYRQGVYYGFTRGFEDGNAMGVRKALKISPKEAEDIHERATEMEIDEMLVKKNDER